MPHTSVSRGVYYDTYTFTMTWTWHGHVRMHAAVQRYPRLAVCRRFGRLVGEKDTGRSAGRDDCESMLTGRTSISETKMSRFALIAHPTSLKVLLSSWAHAQRSASGTRLRGHCWEYSDRLQQASSHGSSAAGRRRKHANTRWSPAVISSPNCNTSKS